MGKTKLPTPETQKRELRKRSSAICVENGRLLMVAMKDPFTGVEFLVPPGGQIETGETPEASAIRETLEETGHLVEPDKDFPPSVLRYDFDWSGKTNVCETVFIICRLRTETERRKIQDEPYILEAKWLGLNDLSRALGFHPELQAHITHLCAQISTRSTRRN